MDFEAQKRQETDLAEQHEAAKFQFISTELELALTFCRIALTSEDREKSRRNRDNADQAYAAAARFLQSADLTESMDREIRPKLTQLKSLLAELHEKRRA
jgi:hypothetical protein